MFGEGFVAFCPGHFGGKQRAVMQFMCVTKMRLRLSIQLVGVEGQTMSRESNSVQPARRANLGNQQW